MKRALFLVILTSFLFGCSSDDEDSPIKGYWIEVNDNGSISDQYEIYVISNKTFTQYSKFEGVLRKDWERNYVLEDGYIKFPVGDPYQYELKNEQFKDWASDMPVLYLYSFGRLHTKSRKLYDNERKEIFPN